jgi:dsDNA-specific endonuclease/ATPase MutS2
MMARFTTGDTVQTAFGKGVVREVRNNGRLLVDVHGRALLVDERDVSPAGTARRQSKVRASGPLSDRFSTQAEPRSQEYVVSGFSRAAEVDLHGLTVEEALNHVERAVNDALLGDVGELRLIHGRSGGRIRAALHRRLKEIPSVRSFAVDPRNEGVTVVRL